MEKRPKIGLSCKARLAQRSCCNVLSTMWLEPRAAYRRLSIIDAESPVGVVTGGNDCLCKCGATRGHELSSLCQSWHPKCLAWAGPTLTGTLPFLKTKKTPAPARAPGPLHVQPLLRALARAVPPRRFHLVRAADTHQSSAVTSFSHRLWAARSHSVLPCHELRECFHQLSIPGCQARCTFLGEGYVHFT